MKTPISKLGHYAAALVMLGIAALTVGAVSSKNAASATAPGTGVLASAPAGLPGNGLAAQVPGQSGLVPVFSARVAPVDARSQRATITNLNIQEHTLDMGPLGIRPVAIPITPGKAAPPRVRNPLGSISPNGGAIGTQNAFMVASPDVVSQSTASAIGTLLSSFTPGESVDYYLNGTLAGTFAANTNGVVAVGISTGAGLGYITFEGIGQTSLKRAGTVAQVLDAAPPVPGFAAAPHAINTTASGIFYAYGFRFLANSTVSLARNGTSLGTAATNAAGRFFITITPANGGDTSAVYSAVTTTVGSMSGASVEERADAGVPPAGDSNLARSFIDRNILPSGTGGTIGWVGEGFQPGETVNVTGCATGSTTATANGAASVFLTFGAGAGNALCVYTGATSGRVARGSIQVDANAINAPSGINAPATLPSGAANFIFQFDRLLPNQSGTVYIDGVSQGAASTNANGYNSMLLTTPATVGVHAVTFIGASGQVAIAPLYIIPSQGTATPTITLTPTRTRTSTASITPTRTATVCVTGNYGFTVSTGTIVSGTVDVGNHTDDGSTMISLPFNYTLYDTSVITAIVGSNGYVSFGTPNNAFNPACMPVATGTYIIAPYWTDQCTGPCTGATCVGCGIFTSTSGVAPNRIFNIEWRTNYYNSANLALNYEVRLFEGQTHFDVIYGTVATFTPPAGRNLSVGVQKNATQYTLVGCDTGGGQNPPVSNGQRYIYTLGACGTSTTTPTVTPTICAGTPGPWVAQTPYPFTEYGAGVASNGTNIYVFGGNTIGGVQHNEVHRYNVAANTYTGLAPMPDANYLVGAEYGNNGKFYVFGGQTGPSSAMRIYDVGSNTWTAGLALPVANYDLAHAYYNGKIYIIGGLVSGVASSTVYAYDIVGNTYTTLAPLPQAEFNMAAGAINGKIYVAGGSTGSNFLTNLYIYDIAGNSWTSGPPMSTGTNAPAGAVAGGKLWVMGGGDPFLGPSSKADKPQSGSPASFNLTQIYDPVANSWSSGPTLNVARSFLGAATASTGSGEVVVAIGGYNSTSATSVNDTEKSTLGSCATPAITATRTNTPTITPTLSRTPSPTFTPPLTLTPTRTATGPFTNTTTPTSTPSFTPPLTLTPTRTATGPPPPTSTRTSTSTYTNTPTPTITPTGTNPPITPTYTPTLTSTPCAIPFTDVFPSDYFYAGVRWLYCRGAISGYNDGTFRPYNNTTRGQLTKIVVLAYGLPIYTPPTPTFRDVPTTHTFYQYIETAYHQNIISGYTCGVNCLEFRAEANVTRAQLTKIIVIAASWGLINPLAPTFRDVPTTHTFYEYIETAVCHQVVSGYTCGTGCLEFRPDASATRGQISKMVYNAVSNLSCSPPPGAP